MCDQDQHINEQTSINDLIWENSDSIDFIIERWNGQISNKTKEIGRNR